MVAATDPAPLPPWGQVEALGDAALDVGAGMLNAAASLGNAALHDPTSIAAVVGGAALMAAGAGGAAGGALATASGVGAPIGVPATAASIGLVVSGAALAGAGAFTVAQNAAGPDRVSPAGSGSGPTAPSPRPAAERPTVTDTGLRNIVDPLYRGVRSPTRTGDGTTADAVRWERASGEDVGGKLHTTKANDSVRALRNWLRRHPGASSQDRGIAQQEFDNLLDALGRTR